jgi:succinyl-diaminopimelate desuccinylase
MPFGEVTNLWARRGSEGPLLAFAGHTDVVPSGPEEKWICPPFTPTERDGLLYGRGAADMKGGVAAMVTACETFLAAHPNHTGSIAFLLTSDEEGPAKDGTVKVIETLEGRGEKIDYCLLGEPSCNEQLGDCIKNGRRGSLNGDLVVQGIQGHVAYPHRAKNPLHAFAPILARLCAEEWDQGNEFFPPTSFQISNMEMGTGAENVIPGELRLTFNFRFSTELDQETITQRMTTLLDQGDFDYQINWRLSGLPFLTPGGALVEATLDAAEAVTGRRPELSTAGGTSDGRFIAPTGAEVLEFGLLNATIHKVNECAGMEDLEQLSSIYVGVLERLLASSP